MRHYSGVPANAVENLLVRSHGLPGHLARATYKVLPPIKTWFPFGSRLRTALPPIGTGYHSATASGVCFHTWETMQLLNTLQ